MNTGLMRSRFSSLAVDLSGFTRQVILPTYLFVLASGEKQMIRVIKSIKSHLKPDESHYINLNIILLGFYFFLSGLGFQN